MALQVPKPDKFVHGGNFTRFLEKFTGFVTLTKTAENLDLLLLSMVVLDGMSWTAVDMRIAKIVRALRESREELLKHVDVKVGRGKGRSGVSAGVKEDMYQVTEAPFVGGLACLDEIRDELRRVRRGGTLSRDNCNMVRAALGSLIRRHLYWACHLVDLWEAFLL